MQALEITCYLDERISELAKCRLPEHPVYPLGDTHYASFMTSREEMDMNGKGAEKWSTSSSHSHVNGNFSDEHKTKHEAGPSNRYVI